MERIPKSSDPAEVGAHQANACDVVRRGGAGGHAEPIVQRINAEFVKASEDAEVMRRLNALGMVIRTTTPTEMRNMMVAEQQKVEGLVQRLNLGQK